MTRESRALKVNVPWPVGNLGSPGHDRSSVPVPVFIRHGLGGKVLTTEKASVASSGPAGADAAGRAGPRAGAGVAGQRPAADIGAEELGRGGGRREVIAGAGSGGPGGGDGQGTHRGEGQGKSQRRALDHASARRTQAGPRSWRAFVMHARLFASFPFMKTRQAAGKAVPLAAAPARQFLSGCRRRLFVTLRLPRAAAMRNSSIGARAAARKAGC